MSICSSINHADNMAIALCIAENCLAATRWCCPECIIEFHCHHSEQCYKIEEIRDFIEKANIPEQLQADRKEKQIHQFFDMIRSQFLKKIHCLEEALLNKLANLTNYQNLLKIIRQGLFSEIKESEVENLRKIIIEQTKARSSLKSIIMNLLKAEDERNKIIDQEKQIWDEIHKEQQQILEALQPYLNLQYQMYKIGEPVEKEKFQSPIRKIQEFFNQKRINYDQVPDEFTTLRGQESGNCFKMEEGDLYMGEILHARPHGRGILIKKNGAIFEGIFDWGEIKWGAHYWWDKLGCIGFEIGYMMDWQLHGKGQKQLATNENEMYI